MTDKELAIRIVQCFNDDFNFHLSEKNLKTLLRLDISSAFDWSETKEGSSFWLRIAQTKIRNRHELKAFLEKNLDLYDSNFVKLELFI